MAILGSLEQKIMDVMWDSTDPMDTSGVLNNLGSEYAYTTVMTVMKRLSDKKLLNREKKGKKFLYTVSECKEEYAGDKLNMHLEELVNCYEKFAVDGFLKALKKSSKSLKYLRDQIENM